MTEPVKLLLVIKLKLVASTSPIKPPMESPDAETEVDTVELAILTSPVRP